MSNQPIGIFDSGIGGLTVFREIAKILPQEDIIYLGDTARVPYGTKSAATVTRYAIQNVNFLLNQNIKMLVIACNTASAFALEEIQSRFPIPVVGVIGPGVRGALCASRSQRIGVIGTEGTIKSESYLRMILAEAPKAVVIGASCPLFVPLVEEGRWEGPLAEEIVRGYLEKILAEKIDALILGCTHYPLLKKTIQKVVGKSIVLIDSAEETARDVSEILSQKNLTRTENRKPFRKFCVTDSPEIFRRVGGLFLNAPLENIEHVEI